MMSKQTIASLTDAIDCFTDTLRAHPERDRTAADRAAAEGDRRRFPVFSLGLQARPDDPDERVYEFDLPEVSAPESPEGNLAREIIGLFAPLQMLNPVRSSLGAGGAGPGTLVPSFGIPLRPDAGNSPAYTRTIEEVLADDPPDAEDSGLLPEIRERIALIRRHVPDTIGISMPDTQGPYNLAHAVVGEEALLAPYTAPEDFHRLMDRVTDFWIAVRENLRKWIGEDRIDPINRVTRICECSTNLISRKMYEESVLPHDIRIAEAFGAIDVHTCSGPHVFHQTLELLPNVVMTEAGFIASTAAGYTPVDEALEAIGDRPITLRIGQELPRGEEFDFIRKDLDRYEDHPRLTFDYTGMHWYNRDCGQVRDLHRRLDDYWERKYG